MTMEKLAEKARAAVERLAARGRTTRIPDEVREVVMRYVAEARSHDISWEEISRTVGLSQSALMRWQRPRRRAQRALLPVAVAGNATEPAGTSGGTITVTTPAGYRVEGLRIDEATELLRTLS